MQRFTLNRAVGLAVAGLLSSAVQAAKLDVVVTGPDGNTLEGMVVYAEPLAGQVMPDIAVEPMLIAQKDKAFAPYIGVVQRNKPVNFINQDDITHHIYSVSGSNRFSFKIRSGQDKQIIAQAGDADSETVAMGCNIHDWMSGYLLVLDTPWFGTSDHDGKVALSFEESGTYRVSVWHPQLQAANNRLSQTVDLQQDHQLTLQLDRPLAEIPEQSGEDDFEFLDDY